MFHAVHAVLLTRCTAIDLPRPPTSVGACCNPHSNIHGVNSGTNMHFFLSHPASSAELFSDNPGACNGLQTANKTILQSSEGQFLYLLIYFVRCEEFSSYLSWDFYYQWSLVEHLHFPFLFREIHPFFLKLQNHWLAGLEMLWTLTDKCYWEQQLLTSSSNVRSD